jgi:hypothetical protein
LPFVYCPTCGRPVPFTGAFAFVVCPHCRAQVHIARASPVPPEAPPPYPSAAGTDRVAPPPTGWPVPPSPGWPQPPPPGAPAPYPLPAPHLIQYVGPPVPGDEPLARRAARFVTSVATALVMFVLANNLAFLLGAAPTAVDYALSTTEPVTYLFLITPLPVAVVGLSGAVAAAWHMALVATITLSAALFVREHARGAFEHFGRVLMGNGSPHLDDPNGFYLMARLFTLSIFTTELVFILAQAVGSQPTIPAGITEAPAGELLIALAHASVWEEVVTRVLLLGVPLLAVCRAGRGKLDRPAWRYLVGGKIPLDTPAVAFLLFSSVAFGLAHVSGWDLWKVPGSFVAGLVFGFLFLRLGLHAAVLCHFLHDYLPVAGFLGATQGYLFLLSAVFLALMVIGSVNFIRYLFVLREIWLHRGVPPHLGGPQPEAPEPPAAPGAPPGA